MGSRLPTPPTVSTGDDAALANNLATNALPVAAASGTVCNALDVEEAEPPNELLSGKAASVFPAKNNVSVPTFVPE